MAVATEKGKSRRENRPDRTYAHLGAKIPERVPETQKTWGKGGKNSGAEELKIVKRNNFDPQPDHLGKRAEDVQRGCKEQGK